MAKEFTYEEATAPPAAGSSFSYEEATGAPPAPSGTLRRVADTGLALGRGIIGVPEAAAGLSDVVTGGRTGKALERAGVRFKTAKEVLTDFQSPEQKAADAEVQQADGFLPTVGAMVRNPSTIANAVAESVPSMLGGGALAQGLVRKGVGAITAGAAGEAAVSAGQTAEQVRQDSKTGFLTPQQAALAAGSGAVTGVLNKVSGQVANKLGIGDINTALATGKLGPVGAEAIAKGAEKGIVRRVAEGAANEGVLQELPQSYQEQVAQNLATGKPWDEGAGAAAASGMLVGGLTGGGAAALSGEGAQTPEKPPENTRQPGAGQRGPLPGVSPSGEGGGIATPQTPQKPAATTKAQAMGIDPAAGPLQASAAVTVDTGADVITQQQEVDRQKAEADAKEKAKPGKDGKKPEPEAPAPVQPAPADPTAPITGPFTHAIHGGSNVTPQAESPAVQPEPAAGAAAVSGPAVDAGAAPGTVPDQGRTGAPSVADALHEPANGPAGPLTQESSNASDQGPQGRPEDAQAQPAQRGTAGPDTEATPGVQRPGEPQGAGGDGSQRGADALQPGANAKGAQPAAVEPAGGPPGSAAPQAEQPKPTAPIDLGAHTAATSPHNDKKEPTDAQKAAGNGELGHIVMSGVGLSIENPEGSVRRNKPDSPVKWETTMKDGHYGYVKGSIGMDGDHVDAFIKPGTPLDHKGEVYIIDQVDPATGKPDEHKVMIGYPNGLAARRAYQGNYQKGWKGLKAITPMAWDEFKAWVKSDATKAPLAGAVASPGAQPGTSPQPAPAAPKDRPSAASTPLPEAGTARPDQRTTAPALDKPEFDSRPSTAPSDQSAARDTAAPAPSAGESVEADHQEPRQVPQGNGSAQTRGTQPNPQVSAAAAQGGGQQVEGEAPRTSSQASPNGTADTRGKQVSTFYGKYGKGMTRLNAELKAKNLNSAADKPAGVTYTAEEHGDPAIENPYAVVGREAAKKPTLREKISEAAAAKKIVKPKGGSNLRTAAWEKNPLMSFLAEHGLYHKLGDRKSLKTEFSPDKNHLVSGSKGGPVFRQNGVQDLQELADLAVQDGFLPQGATADDMTTLIERAMRGDIVRPLYAEGVIESEMEKRQRAIDDMAELQDNEAADLDPDIFAKSNVSTEDAMRALGFTEQEISDATAKGTGAPQEGSQGRGEPDATEATAADAGAQAGPPAAPEPATEGLTAPTRADVLAQQAQLEAEQRRKEDGGDKPLPTKKVTADTPDMFNTQGSVFDQPAEPEPVEPAERFAAGKALTKEQRTAVLKTLVDVYKTKRAPREQKGVGRDGNERYGYVHSPELFEKSDITGAMVRYHVTLPDGRLAHPTELFPDYTQADIDKALLQHESEARQQKATDDSRLRVLRSRAADTLADANRIFNTQNPGSRTYTPATLTDGKQFIRTAPEAAQRDVELLGGGWKEQGQEGAPAKSKIEDSGAVLEGARKLYAKDHFFDTIQTRSDDAGNVAMFAKTPSSLELEALLRAVTPSVGMSVADVRAVVTRLASKWDVPVHVVATPVDLPVPAPADTRGLHLNGTIYLVASTHGTTAGILRTLGHEAIGHLGLREVLGDENWRKMMNQMQFAIKAGNKALREIQSGVRAAYVDDDGKFTLSPTQEADEIAAAAVERAIDPVTGEFKPGYGWLKAAFAKAAQFLRDLGIMVRFTNTELQGMLVTSARHLERGSRTLGQPAPAFSRAVREEGIPPGVPSIASYRDTDALKAHADYKAAKAGDGEAAIRVVRDLVGKDTLRAAREAFGEGAIYASPMAEESGGDNMLPATLAMRYAVATNGTAASGIVQTNRVYHTGAKAMERLISRALFDGPVTPGGRYVLVDDVTTMGSTLAELADHIAAGGGKVVGTVVLADASRTDKMAASVIQKRAIEKRYGDAVRDIFRADPAALTAAEAGYVLGFPDADALRNRAAKAEAERAARLGAKGLQQVLRTPDSGGAVFARSAIAGQTSRQYTAEQLRAMKDVGFQVEEPTLKERAQALWKDAGKKLAQGIVDQFAPVKALDGTAYGLLRLAKGASGAFEAFLKGGKLKLTNNVYDFDDANKGGVIDKLLIPLQGEHHDFMRWVAANRAERLAGEGRENLFTPQDIADLKTLADGNTGFDYTIQTGPAAGTVTRDRKAIYADALRVFNGFNKNVLDLAEQSGLIDGPSRHLWEHEFYVPFYRVADDADGGIRGANIKGGVVRQEAFKSLKGGKNALNTDLLDNTLMNWAHLLDASAKNRAAKATIEAAERIGVATMGNQSTLAQMGASINNKHGVVWFMDQGIKRYSLIDDPYIMTALTSLEYAGMRNPVMNAMSAFKHALTIGVTSSPFFKVRNLIRDSVQAIGTGNLSYNPAGNIAQGWKLTDPKSDAYFRLLAGGGTIHFGTMLEGSEAKRVQALVEAGVDDATLLDGQHKVQQFYRKFIEPGITAYNELGNRGEAINRASLYAQLVAQGMNHAEASLQARDLMDFSMNGSFTTIRFLTQVVPFFNARIQGLYKLGRAAKEDPARFSAVLGAVTLFSLALLAAYGDDDDWKKREEWDRNNYWWFKFGGTAFRIPKPFEIGAIATLAERGFELAFDREMTGNRFRKQVMTLLGDNLSMNPVPQLVKPILDVYSNKDSFSGRPIETMSQERLKSEYRFNDRTSMVARAASTGLNAVTGLVGAEALSPVQIDHLLRGYFGWLGSFIVGAGDVIARQATGQPTRAAPDYWKTATGGMVSDLSDAPSRYVSQMYDQAKEIEQAYGTWRALQKEGKVEEAKEFADDNRDKLAKYHRSNMVKRTESKLNERIRQIERSDMDGAAKREEIRKLQERKDRVARMAPV